MEEPSWWTYLKKVAGTEDGQTIAEAAGVTPPQVSRWKTGKNRPDADKLATFARRYKRPPVEALVAAGYLSSAEATEAIEVHLGLAAITNEELLAEIRRRMEGIRHALETEAQQDASSEATEDQKTPDELADEGQSASARLGAAVDMGRPKLQVEDISEDA